MSWTLLDVLTEPNATIYGTTITDGGQLCLGPGSGDPNVYVYQQTAPDSWDFDTTLSGPPNGFRVVSSAGRYLVGAGTDGEVWVWDLGGIGENEDSPTEWTHIDTLTDATNAIYSLALTTDYLVAATGDGGEVWSVPGEGGSWTHVSPLDAITGEIRGCGLNFEYAAFGGVDGSLTIYDVTDFSSPLETHTDFPDSIWSVSLSDDGSYLTTGVWETSIDVFQQEPGGYGHNFGHSYGEHRVWARVQEFPETAIPYGVVISHDGSRLAASTSANVVDVYGNDDGVGFFDDLVTLDDPSTSVRESAFSDDDLYLIFGTQNNRAFIYHTDRGELAQEVHLTPESAQTTTTGDGPQIRSHQEGEKYPPQTRGVSPTPAPTVTATVRISTVTTPIEITADTATPAPTVRSNINQTFSAITFGTIATPAPTLLTGTGVRATPAPYTSVVSTPQPSVEGISNAFIDVGTVSVSATTPAVDRHVEGPYGHETLLTGVDGTRAAQTGVDATQTSATGEQLTATLSGVVLETILAGEIPTASLTGEFVLESTDD